MGLEKMLSSEENEGKELFNARRERFHGDRSGG